MKGTSSKKEKSVITAKKCDNSKKKCENRDTGQDRNMALGPVLGTGEDCNRRSLSLLMI